MEESPTTKQKRRNRKNCLKTGESTPIKIGGKLDKLGQRIYDDVVDILTKMETIDMADSHSIYVFATSMAEYIRCSEWIQENGFKYETYTREGELRYVPYPEVQAQGKAYDRMRSLIQALHLTPSARLATILDEEDKNESPLGKLLASPRKASRN